MGDFFKGWRRKAGLVTVAFACTFMTGWVRSQVVEDFIEFRTPSRSDRHFLLSTDGLLVSEVTLDASISGVPKWIRFSSVSKRVIEEYERDADRWYLRFGRFGVGQFEYNYGTGTPMRTSVFAFAPYWSIVVPLILFSAYLLFSKVPNPKPGNSRGMYLIGREVRGCTVRQCQEGHTVCEFPH